MPFLDGDNAEAKVRIESAVCCEVKRMGWKALRYLSGVAYLAEVETHVCLGV